MPVENANYIAELDEANPPESDLLLQSDDQHRLIKKAVRQTLPNLAGEVTATHQELNLLAGKTSIPDLLLTITNPQPGQALKYNGPDWINAPDETGGGGGGDASVSDGDFSHVELYAATKFFPSTTANGALEITSSIPTTQTGTMHYAFDVVVRETLSTFEGYTLEVRGIISGATSVQLEVRKRSEGWSEPSPQGSVDIRAGYDGGFFKWWIGELTTNWDWMSVTIENIRIHDRNQLEIVTGFADNWTLTIESSAFGTVSQGPTTPTDAVEARAAPLPVTYTIGATGTYPDIVSAFQDLSNKFHPNLVSEFLQSPNWTVRLRFEIGESWDQELYLRNGDWSWVIIDALDAVLNVDGTNINNAFLICDGAVAPQFETDLALSNWTGVPYGFWLRNGSEFRNAISNPIMDIADAMDAASTFFQLENSSVMAAAAFTITDTVVVGAADVFGITAQSARFYGDSTISVLNCRGGDFDSCSFQDASINFLDCIHNSTQGICSLQNCSGQMKRLDVGGTATQTNDRLVNMEYCNLVFLVTDVQQTCTGNTQYRISMTGCHVNFGNGGEIRSGGTGTGANDLQLNGANMVTADFNANTGINVTKNAFNTSGDIYNGP